MFRKYPAVPVLGFVIVGIVLADQAHIPSWLFFSIASAFGLAALWLLLKGRSVTAAVLAGLALGSLAGCHFSLSFGERGPNHVSKVVTTKEVARMFGSVVDWPDLRQDRTEYVVDLDSVFSGRMRRTEGRLLLKVTDTSTSLQRGDRIEFYGRIYFLDLESAHRSSYLRRLNLKGVAGMVYLPTLLDVRVDRRPVLGVYSLVDGVREHILGALQRNLSPDANAIAKGFLLGETRQISSEVYQMFRDSGTLHVLAVSGANVALVLLFVLLILRPFSIRQPWRGILLLIVVVLFALLSHNQPSVVRASVMAVFVLIAGLLGREYDLNHIVSLTVLAILLAAPGQLFDIGFQLSVVTAWGLVMLVKPVAATFKTWHNRRWYRWLVFPVIISIVAQLCSAPLIAYYFGTVPAASVLANLVVVPLTSVAVIALLVMLIADLVWPVLGFFAGTLVDPLLRLIITSLEWFKSLSLPSVEFKAFTQDPLALFWVAMYFVILILAVFGFRFKRARRMALILALVIANIALARRIVSGEGEAPAAHFTSLPGGILAVVDQPSNTGSDLVFSSSSLRMDNLDSRLLQPVLNMNGVKRLHRIFVINCPYDNIDDLFRLATMYQAQNIYVASSYRPAFEDFLAYHQDGGALADALYFGGPAQSEPAKGYCLSSNRITIVTDRQSIIITDRISDPGIPLSPQQKGSTLVVASRWSPQPDDWIALSQAGFERIICSRIDQVRLAAEPSSPEDEADQILPDFVIDLRRLGPYGLSL